MNIDDLRHDIKNLCYEMFDMTNKGSVFEKHLNVVFSNYAKHKFPYNTLKELVVCMILSTIVPDENKLNCINSKIDKIFKHYEH